MVQVYYLKFHNLIQPSIHYIYLNQLNIFHQLSMHLVVDQYFQHHHQLNLMISIDHNLMDKTNNVYMPIFLLVVFQLFVHVLLLYLPYLHYLVILSVSHITTNSINNIYYNSNTNCFKQRKKTEGKCVFQ